MRGGSRGALFSNVPSFNDFAIVCQSLSQTQSRLQMAEMVGTFLAALDVDEAEISARFMVGRAVEQGDEKRLQVSGRAIWKIVAEMADAADQGEDIFASAQDFGEAVEMTLRLRSADPEPTLTIRELNEKFAEIAAIEGRQSRRRKLDALRGLFVRASAFEGKYIAKILIGEMRHGVSEGLMLEAIARMGARPVTEIRRIHMLEADLGRVVRIVRSGGAEKDASSESTENGPMPRVRAVKPLKPMLAFPVDDVAEAFATLGPKLSLEHKFDGARVQIHHGGNENGSVRIFSRRLNEITESIPDIVEIVKRIGARDAILDGEVIGVDASGRPAAFQDLMRRFGRTRDVEKARVDQPLKLYVFDILALDGELTIDRPWAERISMLDELSSSAGLEKVERIVKPNLAEAEKFYADAVASGYEGVMAKSLASAYTPGARGRGWLKIKHTHTLDLVIVAAEWGYGRRHGWLSNYHLAARDNRGGFAMLGKTFKGLSDDQFRAMTERLLALKTEESHGVVTVRPEVVVEVAYNDIQRSPNYESGMALRFARIVRTRDDKSPDQADSIDAVTGAYERQTIKPLAGKIT